ncbi:SusD/RagB family nutrient-binding outer membrane lipoprotein [Flavitalea sp. BT771]|uniref:SusD/RagB family nutrient-binding outer membrane lipoprotein n=1 Tax=Flavitalea sp. BT771 TaxID=3063329 RepID=UPI0026E31C6E|nr:SusD/RagB family nutrient-binding outer membrane lipoprotein [Flavitalea sp. BT771]MDO6430275.1 SusD/RagB family nutrient-binding outer membrane lipoprotein [Flavitalea sp. BT771]MDV6219585.1 SusD/RagB family nutrient-binding outer membrane lipoprotein [Flavitalea sp. BT771]
MRSKILQLLNKTNMNVDKKIVSYSLSVLFLLAMTSCEKGLSDLNKNKTSPTSLDPALLLNQAIINTSYPVKTLVFDVGIVQQMVTPNGGVLAGANFNQDSRDVTTQPLWTAYYQSVIKNTHDALMRSKDLPARSNMYNMARIFQSYVFMILTDEYGDIPYLEGGAGLTDRVLFPKYDKQQDIYPKIIQELTDAAAALDPAGAIESGDVLYAGNVGQWKKFAYSLLLRAGMRLSKKESAKAQTAVQAAVAGGVITGNADNAYIRHDANFTQPIGGTLNGSEAANFYLTKPFVDQLKSTNDPRLQSIAIRYVGAASGAGQTVAVGSTDPTKQIGMPVGYDNGSIVAKAQADGLASFYDYSQVDRRRIVKISSPVFLVTAAQTNLLLAEARFRGWITSSTADQYFSDGIRAHMDQMALYDPNSAVAGPDREAYVTAHPLTAGNELEQINTQYWIASFLNGPEAFANFRRSGFPALTANPYGQPNNPDVPNGTFIRRLTYPTSELSVNTTNVNEAITDQGPDKLSTQVWWDKP